MTRRTAAIEFVVLAAALTVGTVCWGQQLRQQPLGFLYDSGLARVRPLLGVPGSAIVGGPLDLGEDIYASAASPNQDFLVVLSGTSRTARIWMSTTQAVSALGTVPAGATQVTLSPEATSAAFYYADTNRVHVITGLPSAPVDSIDADLSSLMNPMRSFAVSDDGALVMVSESPVAGNASAAVVVFRANGVAGRIPVASSASAVAFLSKSHDALISDAGEAILIRDAAAQVSRTLLPAAANGAAGAIASTDGTQAFFANDAAGNVAIVSLNDSGASPLVVSCGCTPTGITRTISPSIYRLTGDTGSAVALFDASTNQPRPLVIPPVATAPIPLGNQ